MLCHVYWRSSGPSPVVASSASSLTLQLSTLVDIELPLLHFILANLNGRYTWVASDVFHLDLGLPVVWDIIHFDPGS